MVKKQILNRKYNELSGALHIHTCYSYDCDVSIEIILKYAKKSNLDFITLNDHNNFNAKFDKAFENLPDNPIIIVGAEVNDCDNQHHLLVFNSSVIKSNINADEYLDYYKESVTFAAHPYEFRKSSKFKKYEWVNKTLTGFSGVEIWNYSSSWIASVSNFYLSFLCLIFPSFFVRKPSNENIMFWDKINIDSFNDKTFSFKSAIGSLDAHSHKCSFLKFKFRILTHKKLFNTLRTNVLLNEYENICYENIINALKKGNSYIVNYSLGVPWNFYAVISDKCKQEAIFGEFIEGNDKELYFYFNLPMISDVYLIHNGKRLSKIHDKQGCFTIINKGIYRLEIYRYFYAWIFTNPIYVI